MQQTDREKLKTLVSGELKDIAKHIKHLEERCQPISPDNAIGRLSRMEAIGEQGVQQMALDAARQREAALSVAMQRMANDADFGLCENCDQPIPLARMMLVPESRLCVQCLQSEE